MRRKKGEGSWGKRKINNIEYVTFKKYYPTIDKEKTFYGKDTKEVKQKIKDFEDKRNILIKKTVRKQTFYSYVVEWLLNVKSNLVKERTLQTDLKKVDYYIKPYSIAEIQMGCLKSEIFQEHINMLTHKYSRSTIYHVYKVMKQCLEFAVDKGDISSNPMSAVRMPKESAVRIKRKEIQYLEEDDMDKLLLETNRINEEGNRINGSVGTRVYGKSGYMIALILETGLRLAEAQALQWSDIDFDKKLLSVRRNFVENYIDENTNEVVYKFSEPKTKNSKRIVYLSDVALDILTELRDSDQTTTKYPIFCSSTGKAMTSNNLNRVLDHMLLRAKCQNKCTIHGLRHSFATRMINNGESVEVVSKLLGHASVTITYETYIHVNERRKMEAINKLNSARASN